MSAHGWATALDVVAIVSAAVSLFAAGMVWRIARENREGRGE